MLYLRNILVYASILGMEACWLYAALNAANKAVADILSIPLLLSLLLISYVISLLLRQLSWPKPALAAISWIIWPVALLLMIKIQLFSNVGFRDTVWLASIPQAFSQIFSQFEPALLIFLSTAVLWWLGRRLAYVKPDFAAALTETQFGLIVLILVVFTAYELNLDQSSSIPSALIFFSLALFSVALSHSQFSWFSSSSRGSWSIILLLCIGVILALGIIISFIFSPDLIQLAIRVIKWIWELIVRFMQFIASLLPQPSSSTPPPVPTMSSAGNDDTQTFQLPEWLKPGLTLVWEILVCGFLIAALWRIASHLINWMRRQVRGSGGEVESLKGAFKLDFFNFIKRILAKIFRIQFGSSRKNKSVNTPPGITSVRLIYTELLQWAGRNGFPRSKAQTPEEFRGTIENALGANQDELSYLTRQYMNSRYGAVIPSETELNQIKQKWHDLKKAGLKKPGGK